ncbi:hypothetical protein ACFC89_13440 [Enterococcus casseliflavus]|uniref:hypothetical protein n=1 Tax=Enterococcus casseliflavus TaxID=37734 RepID=UPI0039A6A273
MATIQLFISDTPLCFEKAEFTFMEESFVIEKQQLFEKVDAVMHQEVSSALVSLVEKALLTLEAIGEEEDYFDLLYLTYENTCHSLSGQQLLAQPFPAVEAALQPVFDELAEPIVEKFYEELTNQLEEVADDELFSSYYLDEEEAVIQIVAPIQHEEVIALPALLRDYHGTLRLTFEKFYEYLV